MRGVRLFGVAAALLTACSGGMEGMDMGTDAPGGVSGFMVMTMQGGLHLMWNDTFSGETGFEVQRKGATGDFAKVTEAAANAIEYMDMAPTGTRYTYRVRALASAGPGAWSAEASETAP